MGYIILKGEGAIRSKIRDLFSTRQPSRRRLILGPLKDLAVFDYLPDIHNIELYSWDQDSFTDKTPFTSLAKRGAKINWVNPMHLRLYWVKGKGAVIGPGFDAGALLAEMDQEDPGDLALYLDAAASMVVDEVLGPLSWEPPGSDTFSDFQENCNLLWRLAEGITLGGVVKKGATPALPRSVKIWPDESPQTRDTGLLSLESRQWATTLESWYNFLGEETHKTEGLLCFYDRPRTKRVENCCLFFLGLGGPMEEGPGN